MTDQEASKENAKSQRRNAKAKFTRKLNENVKSIDEKRNQEVVGQLFAELKEAWSNVESKHENYCAYLSDDECENEEEWISEIHVRYVNAMVKNTEYESEYKEQEKTLKLKEQQTEIRKKEQVNTRKLIEQTKVKRDLNHGLFQQLINDLQAMLKDEEKLEVAVLIKLNKELDSTFKECKEISDKYIELLAEEDCDVSTDILWMKNLQQVHSRAIFEIERRIARGKQLKEERSNVRLEKTKLPMFDGNLRNYARFKTDFQKQVQPHLSKEAAPYTLRSCLGREPLKIVKSVDDDLDMMWKYLDGKYADPAKVVDAIMNVIHMFKPMKENDNKKFVEFVDVVEDSYRDLVRLGLEMEITTTSSISIVEKKLPPDVKREWSKTITNPSIDKTDKFRILLEFLINQRRAIEYESSNIRINAVSTKPIVQTVHFADNNQERTKPIVQTENNQVTKSPYRRCLIHGNGNHWTDECKQYISKTIEEKRELLKEKKACWSCLKPGHSINDCKRRRKCGENGCMLNHHRTIHEEKKHQHSVSTCNSSINHAESCLLQYQKIKTPKGTVNALWDSAASLSFITYDKAKAERLHGKNIDLNIVTVGGKAETLNSKEYTLTLIDKEGNTVNIVAYGIEQITSTTTQQVNVNNIVKLFEGVHEEEIERPVGPVDVLIGYNYADLHPKPEQKCERLLLLSNNFGRCIGGCIPNTSDDIQVSQINHACLYSMSPISTEDFFSIENLGVACKPQCGGCRCGKCCIGAKNCSLKEEREMKLIEKNLDYDDVNKVWTAVYPWIKNPEDLPDNELVATKMLESTERRLQKNPSHAKVYQEQIQDMVSRGVARKLTKTEKEDYNGPVHYISHHEVLRPESTSTPVRIVFNSSANYKGHSLNDYWAKGPDLLNNLLAVLLRFREDEVALMGDVKKMYHSVKISPLDQHTHRFLWRDMEVHRNPDVYIIERVSFGDKPSGAIATLAMRKTAEMSQDEYPQAARTVIDNSYMDDIIDSVSSKEEAMKLTEDIDKILKKGNFNMKSWIVSQSSDVTADQDINLIDPIVSTKEKVLGVLWDPKTDNLHYKIKLNFSPKRRKLHTESDITVNEIPHRFPDQLTKRMILSQVNGIYDPLGLAGPITVKAKIMMRKLWTENSNLDWDEPIPTSSQDEWLQFFQSLFEMENISFNRCLKPAKAEGPTILVIFSDASKDAYGACAYVRWKIDGSFASSLVLSKNRLTPAKQMSIDRLELCAAVLNKRIKEFIERETRWKFEKIYHIVDSQIVQAQVQKESYGYNTFVATRVGEIQEGTNPNEWYWIEGELNVADYLTRGKSPSEIDESSIWQHGPEFLKKPESEWPISNNCYVTPQAELIMNTNVKPVDNLATRIDIVRFSSYTKLIRVTARVLTLYGNDTDKPSLKNACKCPNPDNIKKAEVLWIKEAQKNINIKDKNLRRLCPARRSDGIIVVKGRLENWMDASYNQTEMILLPYKHAFSRLYAAHIHRKSHCGVSATVSKIRVKYWIIGVHKLVKSIKFNCVTCKKLDKELAKQQMGQLPIERLKPSPPWYHCGVDLFGPFQIRDAVKKRTTGKAYGVIFTCMSSRAVHVDVAADYSTEKFLMVLRRFVSLRGYPRKLLSDNGPQLVKANQELNKMTKSWEWNKLQEFGATEGLEWEFTPADAPWRNGVTESLIKSVKKALTVAVKDNVMTFSELQTVFYEAANLVNERPIGRHPTSTDDGYYLCPNNLLLGRCSSRVPSGPFKETCSPAQRFEFVQRICNAFWKHWTRDFFPSLTVRTKWHTAHRNVMVNDIVIIQDSNQVRGNWKIGKITKVYPDSKGKVRKVDVIYKHGDSTPTTVQRAVQRLVVILPANQE